MRTKLARFFPLFPSYLLLLLLLAAPAHAASTKYPIALTWDGVNLEAGLTFEQFLATGRAYDIADSFDLEKSVAVAPFFADGVRRVDVPVTMVVFASTTSPESLIVLPFLEAMHKINPLVKTRYFVRDETPEAAELLLARTRMNRVPTVFVAREDGSLLHGAYVEFPARLYAEIRESGKDARGVVDDFRAGAYDEEVQMDLVRLLNAAADGYRDVRRTPAQDGRREILTIGIN